LERRWILSQWPASAIEKRRVRGQEFLVIRPLKTGGFSKQASSTTPAGKPVETEVFDPRGIGGSNPSPSSGKSATNLKAKSRSATLDLEGSGISGTGRRGKVPPRALKASGEGFTLFVLQELNREDDGVTLLV